MEETFSERRRRPRPALPEPANVFRVKGKVVNPAKGGWAFLLDQITKKGAKVLTQLGSARKGEMPEEQLTLEEWIAGATSNETVHRLFRNLSAAIFAVNADEIPAKAFLTYFMYKGAFRRFGFHPEGTIGVCQALADVVERDGGEVWLDSEVTALHSEDGARDRRDDPSATARRSRSTLRRGRLQRRPGGDDRPGRRGGARRRVRRVDPRAARSRRRTSSSTSPAASR